MPLFIMLLGAVTWPSTIDPDTLANTLLSFSAPFVISIVSIYLLAKAIAKVTGIVGGLLGRRRSVAGR